MNETRAKRNNYVHPSLTNHDMPLIEMCETNVSYINVSLLNLLNKLVI